MLRRIVSLGQQASESDDDPMAPPVNDANRSSDTKGQGGLAGVFKGLTGAKLTKSGSSVSGQPTTAATFSPLPLTAPLATAALSSSSIASTQPASDSADGDSLADRPHNPLAQYSVCLEQLRNGTLNEKTAAAAALRSLIADFAVDSIFEVWHAAQELIEPSKPQTARHAGWDLLVECAGHASSTSLERKEYFQTITAPHDPVDFPRQLLALINLTANGRNLSGFDYDVFPVLTEWFQVAYKASKPPARKPSSSARGSGGKAVKTKPNVTDEERDLSQLFSLTIDVIKYNSKVASDGAIEALLDVVLDIAMNTSAEDDLASCIAIINTCVTVGAMPKRSLESCVKVLSSIFCLVPKLKKSAGHVLADIFKSHHGLRAIQCLLRTLRTYPQDGVEIKDATREVRGALAALGKLIKRASSSEYPPVPFALLVDGLGNVASQAPTPRVVASILQLINQLFDTGDGVLSPLLVDEDWAPLLGVATMCAKRSSVPPSFDGGGPLRRPSQSTSNSAEESSQDVVDRESAILMARLEELLRGLLTKQPEYNQRNSCIAFLADVHPILPDSGAELVLKYFEEFRCCFPTDPQWDANLRLVLDAFYANQTRSAIVRLRALQTAVEVQDVLELVDGAVDAPDAVADLIRRILARVGEERDTVLLHHAVAFAVSCAASVDTDLFDYILEALGSVVKNDVRRQPLARSLPDVSPGSDAQPTGHADLFIDQSTSNIATRGCVQIFMNTMGHDASKATKAFDALVNVAKDQRCPVDARLTALKLLFRLRADWANRVFLVSHTESESLAAVLLRTEASVDRKIAEEVTQKIMAHQARNEPEASSYPLQNPTSRLTRGVSFSQGKSAPDRTGLPPNAANSGRRAASTDRYRQLWSLPDPEALPQAPSAEASMVLFSHQLDPSTAEASWGDVRRASRSKSSSSGGGGNVKEEDASGTGSSHSQNNLVSGDGPDDGPPTLVTLDMASWMEVVFDLLTKGTNWELYSFAVVHLPSQLSNMAVCRGAVPIILRIRAALCEQVRLNSSQEPPAATGLRRPDVQTCVLQVLTMILSYHEHFQRQEEDDLVRTFITGLTDKNPVSCVHALTICCYELPNATSKSLVTILQKMSQIITRPGVAMHILELLACLSRLPWLYSNFREDEYRIAFGVCFRYLQAVRDRRISSRTSGGGGSGHYGGSEQTTPSAATGYEVHGGAEVLGQGSSSSQPNASDDLPQYVYALAYHVLTFWFLAVRLPDRASYVTWITSRLFIDNDGRQITDEQAQITLDFMQRVAFSDAGESAPNEELAEDDRNSNNVGGGGSGGGNAAVNARRSWVIGNSIITICPSSKRNGSATIIKRQPSGTSYYTIHENLQPPPPHHEARGITTPVHHPLEGLQQGQPHHSQAASNSVFPSHLLAQLLAPVPQPPDSPLKPILLPDDEAVARSLRAFDRSSTVDGHKVGVIYVGEGQTDEAAILANVSGSSDYVDFLHGLGTLVRLKGATFNTQGLDREYDTDGAYAFCWRDRVTEMVFHVTTQMPTDTQRDPQCIHKKRHIGNDYVNIIFNDSGLPFRFDTFPSQFNYVNIVVTPESRASFVARRELSLQKKKEDDVAAMQARQQQPQQQPQQQQSGDEPPQPPQPKRAMPFYKVQVMSKPGFPQISPAAETKIVSLKALPDFIRLLALNASVFSLVWANRQGGEHISSWRNRLREINRLRERFGPGVPASSVAASPPPVAASGVGGTAGGSGGGGGGGGGGSGSAVTAGGGGGGGGELSRPSVSGMRDSFTNSLRRSSMATFFTVVSDPNSHRSSVHSTATATTTASDNTETAASVGGTEAWVESLDFSKWT
ncbi:GTPase activating protein [Niveomyces insectorum RCEF 264]|uniref:GTPase activating protein n=1 Tax=Niveomyces insectorum RCEF 264 TaxID=1081102 RepID=A0A167X445_9HYPO|nr:GTPase activating protein [Niveomyces insectorum RCEF 264]